MKLLTVLLISALCLLSTGFSHSKSKPRLVGNILKKGVMDGCGCYFTFRGRTNSEHYIFAESIEKENGVWMNIDGRDIQLTAVKDWSSSRKERVGSRFSRSFAANNISVASTFKVTRVCARNDENCESSNYDATFVVKKEKRVERVRAVGVCGC